MQVLAEVAANGDSFISWNRLMMDARRELNAKFRDRDINWDQYLRRSAALMIVRGCRG